MGSEPGYSGEVNELEPEKILPGHTLERVLGRGGFGVAYLLREEETNELVVLKALMPDRFWDRSSVDELYREITRLLQIPPHPNVVSIRHGFIDPSSNTPYLMLEYVPRGDLWSFVHSGPTLPLCDCWWVLLNVVEGMRFLAEDAGVVHRDLKPQNMLIDSHGIIKISDFGLARIGSGWLSPGDSIARIDQSGIAGTLPFMSPEQVTGEAEVDERSDMWAIGVCLYWLTTGRLPFQGPALADDIVSLQPAAPSAINPHLDDALESMIMRCLEKHRDHRYPTLRDLELTAMTSVNVQDFLAEAEAHTRLMTREAIDGYLLPYLVPDARRARTEAQQADDGVGLQDLQRILNLIQLNDLEQAERMVRDGLAQDPASPILACFEAMILARQGSYEQAAEAFETLLDSVGEHPDEKVPALAYAEAMALYRIMGRYDLARAVHRRAEERMASEPDPSYREHFEETIREVAAEIHHQYDKELAQKLGVDIDFDAMFDDRPEAERELMDELAAAKACKRAIELVQRGLYEPALATFQRAIGLAPDYGYAWADMGTCLMEMERYPEAFQALERARDLGLDDDFTNWFHLAKVSAKLHRWDEAVLYFDEAVDIEPDRAEAWFHKGCALLEGLDDPAEALSCFETAKRLGNPDAAEKAEQCWRRLEGKR